MKVRVHTRASPSFLDSMENSLCLIIRLLYKKHILKATLYVHQDKADRINNWPKWASAALQFSSSFTTYRPTSTNNLKQDKQNTF
ncbi:hypothetical protein RND71_026523 [Anisodus tanguticus]|uniref:Uncharacterized protein n=1 Tax=Anisodus tanguticus TaxID=243964 RepID=A0AAE1RKZ1_9SOLA|nr:hypothetical protein RND71_026523 [Anisodus tanguticus]